jgi:ABC-type molybdenum transport system ATPase subunit/photorepair protein PhrA
MTRTHVITGSFGSGKTTAIRWLMAYKPESELWVVILNEFTDAGIDALSVAQSARGNYDVRLVAGAFRHDGRIEIVLTGAPTAELLVTWRSLLRDAANPPRR